MADYSPGLEGVIAGETRISSITDEGLRYRGYPIQQLATRCSFEDVAFLLLEGELPEAEQRESFAAELNCQRKLHPKLADLVRQIPGTAIPMDAIRSAVSLAAHFDHDVEDSSREGNVRKTIRLLAQVPALIGTWHHARHGGSASEPVSGGSHAAYLLQQITGREPDPEAARVMNTSLILYAEHELNASTFAARVTVSSRSDMHSGVVSAIGTLKGPLHGGANEAAMEMLLEIGSPENAEAYILDRLARKNLIMGFGHRVVRKGDSRVPIIQAAGEELARHHGDDRWQRIAAIVQETVDREKGLHPNVDFPSGWVYYMLGLPVDLYTPIFVAARVVGWCAHIIEQLEHNRIMRPRGIYVGPDPRNLPA
jgi:2-methylcitrate synthase/citrate synthase II